jgi:tetratricopeptide (TPR) repeat protein
MSAGETKPNRVGKPEPKKKPSLLTGFFTLLLFGGALLILAAASGWLGYNTGERRREGIVSVTQEAYLSAQFDQAVLDAKAENYDLARERLHYIQTVDPQFQLAQDMLNYIDELENVTPTPTVVTPTATPSPTVDLRPLDDQFNSILSMIAVNAWDQALEMLANLRAADPDYRVVELDGLIYLCLRNRGIEKILNGDLANGIYDFTLAEQFGPIDAEADNYRNWARLYLLGNAFWGAYPEQAANYYGQLVAAAPNLSDASGNTAFYRYWYSVFQIGENLAKEQRWCAASNQMQIALSMSPSNWVAPTATYAYNQCLLGTPSVTPTPSITPTYAETPTPTLGAETDTPPPVDTDTPVPPEATPTFTATPETPEP